VIRKGEPWGRPAAGPPDLSVEGDDADLAAAVRSRPGARVRFVADATSDLARAVGLAADPSAATELPVDGLLVEGSGELAVNMVVVGTPPDRLRAWHRRRPCTVEVDGRVVFHGRATTVVVATGEFLRGLDVVPRGHPGDGRCEVQVYAMRAPARSSMRRRLPGGDHVPHPEIVQLGGRAVVTRFGSPRPVELDGRSRPPAAEVALRVVPEALVLLV
jgi:YegS C-terminal NAD kinase beta sandwich-like domain